MVKSDRDARASASGVFVAASVISFLAACLWPGHSLLHPEFPNRISLLWGVLSGVFEGAYVVTLGLALSRSGLGSSYAVMRGGAMAIVWIFSVSLLSEPFGLESAAGVLLILIGLHQLKKPSLSAAPFSFQKFFSVAEQKWAYISAIFIAGYHLTYGAALKEGAGPLWLFSVSMIVGMPLMFFLVGSGQRSAVFEKIKSRPWLMLTGGLFCTASFLIFLIGLGKSGPGFAISIRNTSVAFAQVFALALGETVSSRQWTAIALVLVGATLVAVY